MMGKENMAHTEFDPASLEILSEMIPDKGVLFTDLNQSVLFANGCFLKALSCDLEDLKGKSLQSLLVNEVGLEGLIEKKDKAYPAEVELCITDKLSSVKLFMSLTYAGEGGYIFLFNEKADQNVRGFNVTKEADNQVVLINEILGAVGVIETSFKKVAGPAKLALDLITKNAWQLKEMLQGVLKTLVKDLPKGFDVIDFEAILNRHLQLLKIADKRGLIDISFDLDSKASLFFSDPVLVDRLFENLIANCLRFKNSSLSTNISIGLSNWDHKGVMIVVKDDGKGIPIKLRKAFFNKNFTGAHQGKELSHLLNIVHELNGLMTLDSKLDVGTSVTVYLPHFVLDQSG